MQINLKNPATQKLIIVCALAFGVVYGYTNFVYTPRRERTIKLKSEIEKETQLLARGKRIAANFQTVQDDYARLMQSWEIAHDLLPTEKEMEGLLKSITLEGQERDVSFLLFRPLDPIEKPYYWENPIQIKTESSYHNLAKFLSAVASLDRIVNVNDLKLIAFKPGKGKSSHTVVAEFTASIYIFKDLGAPATVASAKPAAPGGDPKSNPRGSEKTPPAKPRPGGKEAA